MADITGEDEWSDWEDEELPAKSLLQDTLLPSAKEALEYDKETHGFDLLALRTKLGLDFYGCAKLVNYVRTEVDASDLSTGVDVKATAAAIESKVLDSQGAVLADERYLRPALADDAILLGLEELLRPRDDDEEDTATRGEAPPGEDADPNGQPIAAVAAAADAAATEKGTDGRPISFQKSDGHHVVPSVPTVEVAAGELAEDARALGSATGAGRAVGGDLVAPSGVAPAFGGLVGGAEEEKNGTGLSAAAGRGDGTSGGDVGGREKMEMEALERENARLREALREAEEKMERANRVLRGLVGGGDDAEGGGAHDGGGDGAGSNAAGGVDNDTYYFRSYAHWGVHETMLTDTVRTGGYEKAICGNADFFKGKVVLDVGCGTGVLSCFAARAGACKVIGVDRSDIVTKAREVVTDNGFEGVVTLVKGKVEDVDIGVEKVDVIISEWMGYCLFYESMLPSVLFARDKYLADGGVLLPDRTPLFIHGWRDPDGRLEFWKNVHGLDYSSMADLPLDEASVEVVRSKDVVTERCLWQDFNMETVQDEDLDFSAPFELKVTSPGTVSGLVISFDTGFFAGSHPPPSPPLPSPPPPARASPESEPPNPSNSGIASDRNCKNATTAAASSNTTKVSWFSTGPESTPTHWKQTLLWLRPSEREGMTLDRGDAVVGRLSLDRNEVNPRELGLRLTWSATRQGDGKTFGGTQAYAVC